MGQIATKADIVRIEHSMERMSHTVTVRFIWIALAAVVAVVLFR